MTIDGTASWGVDGLLHLDVSVPPPLRFPDESTTGPKPNPNLPIYTGPKSANGTWEFRTNQVVENVEIQIGSTGLYIAASVTSLVFRNVRFVYMGGLNTVFTAINNQGSNVEYDHCEVDGRSNVARGFGGNGSNTWIHHCNVHHTGNAIEMGGPLVVEDSYLHDIYTPVGQDWHSDGIQTSAGLRSRDITIRRNTILLLGKETGCINLTGDATNPAQRVLIEENLIAGGGYSMYTRRGDGATCSILNNRFSTRYWPNVGFWGIWYNDGSGHASGFVRSGNVIHETGVSVDAP